MQSYDIFQYPPNLFSPSWVNLSAYKPIIYLYNKVLQSLSTLYFLSPNGIAKVGRTHLREQHEKFSDSLYNGFFVTLRIMNKLYYINNCGRSEEPYMATELPAPPCGWPCRKYKEGAYTHACGHARNIRMRWHKLKGRRTHQAFIQADEPSESGGQGTVKARR